MPGYARKEFVEELRYCFAENREDIRAWSKPIDDIAAEDFVEAGHPKIGLYYGPLGEVYTPEQVKQYFVTAEEVR